MNYIEDFIENITYTEDYNAVFNPTILDLNENFTLTDTFSTKYKTNLLFEDNLNIIDSLIAGKRVKTNLTDGIVFSEELVAKKVISLLFEDNFTVSNEILSPANYISQIVDNLNFNAVLSTYKTLNGNVVTDSNYDCWVVNKDNLAFSRYTNYYFNSFCKLNDKYYGVNEVGLFELSGINDNGDDIQAKIVTGKMDLSGIGSLSYMRDIILYLQTDGTVKLKIKASDGKEEIYRLTNTNNEVKSSRINLSKGRKAVYWQFEITNDGISSFDLQNTKVYRIITQRLS